MMALASQTFWASLDECDAELHELSARHTFGPTSAVALAALIRARDAYFASFDSLGIGETAIRHLIHTHYSISPEEAFQLSRKPF